MRYNAKAPGLVAAAFAAALVLTACGPRDTTDGDTATLTTDSAAGVVEVIKVSEIQLGKKIGPDMRVTDATTNFAPRDTVYISVATTGTGQNATLMLMVTALADSTAIAHENKTLSPTAPAVTEFHISKPEGLKVGKYRAEVYLNGGLAETKEFEVKRPGA